VSGAAEPKPLRGSLREPPFNPCVQALDGLERGLELAQLRPRRTRVGAAEEADPLERDDVPRLQRCTRSALDRVLPKAGARAFGARCQGRRLAGERIRVDREIDRAHRVSVRSGCGVPCAEFAP
jgi:hypothetical protein